MAKRTRSTYLAKLIIFGFRLDRPKYYLRAINQTDVFDKSLGEALLFASQLFAASKRPDIFARFHISDEIKLRSTLRTLIANKINVKRLTRV